MKEKFEASCQVSQEEFNQMIIAKWPNSAYQPKTLISYTYDIDSAPENMMKNLKKDYSNATFSTLSTDVRAEVDQIMSRWTSACGDKIEFHYESKLEPNQPGITLLACSNLTGADGLTEFSFKIEDRNLYFHKTVVCLPAAITGPFDRHTISHELGHALGLNHTHTVNSIKQRLMVTEQGLGCSVMGYNFVLFSPQNQCKTAEYCANASYAVFPGPMDRQICTNLYKFPELSQAKYFSSMFLGLINGSIEKTISELLVQLKCVTISRENSELFSLAAITLVRLKLLDMNFNYDSILVAVEVLLRLEKSNSVEMIKLLRTLAGIVSLFMYLYQVYKNEDALNRAIYLSVFIACNYCGSKWGELFGSCAASVTNTVVDNLTSLFNWGSEKVSGYRNLFFSLENNNNSSEDEIESLPINQDILMGNL